MKIVAAAIAEQKREMGHKIGKSFSTKLSWSFAHLQILPKSFGSWLRDICPPEFCQPDFYHVGFVDNGIHGRGAMGSRFSGFGLC